MDKFNPEILIIGGGLTGLSLCLALKNTPYSVLLCDAAEPTQKLTPHFDARSIALNQASQQILNQLGLWEMIKPHATPIQTIHVSSQGRFGCTNLKAEPNHPLGVVVEMHRLHHAMHTLLPKLNHRSKTKLLDFNPATRSVTLADNNETYSLTPHLLIAADGTTSTVRRLSGLNAIIKKYTQHALVANLALKRPHHFQAFEHFTPHGPMAFLPLEDNRVSLVWCTTPYEATRLHQLSPKSFLNILQNTFGYRLGRFTEVGTRMIYPLEQLVMPALTAPGLVFIGNAAQTLHPVAGQGLNLGLRDVATLAQCIQTQGINDVMLRTYQTTREPDRRTLIHATNGLLQLFQNTNTLFSFLRQCALFTFDQTHLLESTLIRYASGLGGHPPDLACGIELGAEHAT